MRCCLLLGWLLWLGTNGALAQRTLIVQAGKMWLDGQPVDLEQLAISKEQLAGASLRLQFYGEKSPIFSLDGQFFQVQGHRIVPIEPLRFFHPAISTPDIIASSDTVDHREAVLAELIEQARALQEEAARVYRSIEHRRQIYSYAELGQRLAAIQQRAAALSERVRLLPRLEWETYLMRMQRQDAELARRLVEEWQWEQMLQDQAARIRQMPAGPAREAAIAELRRQLEEVFERKQQNRRREIAQLEQQLRLLQKRLDERERYRQHIIEQRLRELLGEH